MNKYIFKSMSVLCGALLAASCTSSFDDVNTDPDRPLAEEVPSTNILAYCERYASDNMFDEWFDLNESCGFSGQISKWMYTQEGYYNFRPTVNSSSWTVTDRVCSNLKTILDKEDPTSNMWAVATIFQCQIFQVKSDRWGNIPYWTTTEGTSMKNEAYRLEDSEGGITTPAYDKQSDIYPDLLTRLAKAVKILEAGDATDEIGDGDGLLGGDIAQWIKYGNALRLRIAARIANVDPTLAKQTFETVMADGAIPADNYDNVFFEWNAEYPEPWADYYQTRNNEYGVSELMINTLKDLDDPRLGSYATPIRADGESYVGYPVGTKATATVKNYSQIGNRFQNRSGVTGFSPWLRSCEVYFAIAYAASKGWNVGMSEQEAYETAVYLSLDENEVATLPEIKLDENGDKMYDYIEAAVYEKLNKEDQDLYEYVETGDNAGKFRTPQYTTAYQNYITHSAKYDGSMDKLFQQWWISLFKNGMEAWSVYRMAPTTSWLFKNNKIAVNSYYPNHNCPPMCYGYPDTERNLNTANCSAESAAEVDYFWGKQMWWDTRTGLK